MFGAKYLGVNRWPRGQSDGLRNRGSGPVVGSNPNPGVQIVSELYTTRIVCFIPIFSGYVPRTDKGGWTN